MTPTSRRTILALFALLSSPLFAAAPAPDFPVYVQSLANPNDYTIFANAGWDGNWYVGYDTLWIKKLPPIRPGRYKRAYIGARLGRAKLRATGSRAWEREAIPGDIFIGLSSTMAWTSSQRFKLTDTSQIPAEGDFENPILLAGESQWFWTEIPLATIDPKSDHFLAVWAATPGLVSASSSPIIAAGWGGKEPDTWLSHGIQGAPPATPIASAGSAISYFQPAMALKLIPDGPAHPPAVQIVSWQDGTPDRPSPTVTANVTGPSVERAWIEAEGRGSWRRVGRPLWKAPYVFTLAISELPKGKIRLRVVAANSWEETGASSPVTIQVDPLPAAK